MNIIENEIIGELRYLTVEFDQAELLAGHIGVISQGAVRRYFEGKSPDLKVKKCGSLKLDSQRDIVTMRFGVVKKSTTVTIVDEFAGPDNDYSAAQKLLNPGYDELRKKYNELQHEKDIVGRLYDALVTAVSKDAQKFSDLLVGNEKLKEQNVALAECAGVDISPEAPDIQIGIKGDKSKVILVSDPPKVDGTIVFNGNEMPYKNTLSEDVADLEQTKIALFAECPHCVENEELKTANVQQKEKYDALTKTKENIADLADAKKTQDILAHAVDAAEDEADR